MKKWILCLMMAVLTPVWASAQSSMTDDQVMSYIVKEYSRGTSQGQIVTHLMQSGVNIEQIRRVRAKLERQRKQSGLGNMSDAATGKADSRMRSANGKGKGTTTTSENSAEAKASDYSDYRIQRESRWQESYDENDPEFMAMSQEMDGIVPKDSIQWLNEILKQQRKAKNQVFGRNIFNNKNLTFEPDMNIATPQNYRLGPGDAVNIDIYGASQKSVTATVSPDGDIVIEDFGPINVGGLTIAQANARIRSQLGARYQSSRIKISLGQTRTITINVMGEVKNPGTYTLSAFASVFHALYMAGGTNDLGTLRNIKIYRHNRLVSVCDIYDYILNGKMTGNVRLTDGDVIIVGPYDCLVNISGKVKRPMFYEMKKNESIGTLLKYAGGFTGDAYRKSVRVLRKTGRERAVFNIGEFDMSNFHVEDGDSVMVDSIMNRYANTVELKGAVFRPGMYQLGGDINSVRSLLQHADGVKEDAFTAHAVMHRMKADRTLEVIPVDVEGIMSGKAADIPLKENDVLFIPTNSDMMDQKTITIHGEVQYPGIYKYASNETIEDFILQAGGLKETASTVKVDVARRTSNPKALSTDSVIANTYTFALKDGFVIDGQPGFVLMPFDEVYVRKSPAYSVQQNVSIEGQVIFPGSYTMNRRSMRLTDLLKAAGGATDLAYIEGAKLERVPTESERARMEAAFKMQQEQLQQQLIELAASSSNSNIQQMTAALQEQLQKYQVPNTITVGIELDKALKDPNSDANIILRDGDRLTLPAYTATVKISGAVMGPNTVAYERGKRAKYYVNTAGGFAQNARKSGVYIVYMNGRMAKVSEGAKVQPGCEIVVPSKIGHRMSIAETLTLGSGIASIATMIATIANLVK